MTSTTTDRSKVEKWFLEGKERGDTHLLVVCDLTEYEDFPVFINTGEDVANELQKLRQHKGDKALEVLEVFNLNDPMGPQLAEAKAWNIHR